MSKAEPGNFCRDCRFISLSDTDYAAATCLHPSAACDKVDPVSGQTSQAAPYLCSYARGLANLCGRHGRYFVAR